MDKRVKWAESELPVAKGIQGTGDRGASTVKSVRQDSQALTERRAI